MDGMNEERTKMAQKLSKRALSLKPSPIQELSHLAQRCNAINLAEGFPDFPAPSAIKDAAIAAITADFNQYSPHNPTGKVFSRDELAIIAKLCCSMDCLAVTDEVYEHITFDSAEHISLASFPGMLERTIITSSLSKTYSVTGWRVGWAIAPVEIASAIRNVHVKVTDSAPAPFQEAALIALQSPPEYFESLRMEYKERRDFILELLNRIGFKVCFKPQGAFFVFAELPATCAMSDVEYVAEMIKVAGVAAVPGCGFFHAAKKSHSATGDVVPMTRLESVGMSNCSNQIKDYWNRYVRFAYCKSKATLVAAADKLYQHK